MVSPTNKLVSEPRSSEKQKCFGRYPNFQSCPKQVLIIPPCRAHPYELTGAKISLIGDGGRPHAPPEDSALFDHAQTTRPEVEDECFTRAPYSRRAEPTSRSPRAEPPAEPTNIPENIPFPSRAARHAAAEPIEYSAEYSRFNPSEPPDAQNRYFDRFTHFRTRFLQSQTGSLLFGPFRIDLQCPFGQIQLTEGDIVIQRAK